MGASFVAGDELGGREGGADRGREPWPSGEDDEGVGESVPIASSARSRSRSASKSETTDGGDGLEEGGGGGMDTLFVDGAFCLGIQRDRCLK